MILKLKKVTCEILKYNNVIDDSLSSMLLNIYNKHIYLFMRDVLT